MILTISHPFVWVYPWRITVSSVPSYAMAELKAALPQMLKALRSAKQREEDGDGPWMVNLLEVGNWRWGWVKTLVPSEPQNSWDLWMFIPLKMYL